MNDMHMAAATEAPQVEHGAVAGAEDEALRAQLTEAEEARRNLVAELIGLGATMTVAMEAHPGFMPCGHAFAVVIDGLAASAASTDAVELRAMTDDVRARNEHVAQHRGVSQIEVAEVRAAMGAASGKATMRAHLLVALQGIALAAQHAMALGIMLDTVNVTLINSLAALGVGEDTENVHECLIRCNAAAAQALSIVR